MSMDRRRDVWIAGIVLLIVFGVVFYLSYRFPYLFTTERIQTVALIGAVVSAFIIGRLGIQQKLKIEHLLWMIIILGILLRFTYFFYTGFLERQHDVGGDLAHQGYIEWIARTGKLPSSGEGQYYHPPVHYIISALVFKAGEMIGLDDYYQWRLVQYMMVIVSCLSLFFALRILRLIASNNRVVIFGTALFSFHPTNILLSAQINNDNVMVFFYILVVYYLIKWFQSKKTRDIVLLAIMVSLAILSKKNAVMVLPVIAIAFIMEFANPNERWKRFRQYMIFTAIALPLSVSHIIRNMLLFNQGLNYSPVPPFKEIPNYIANFLTLPLNTMFQNPFVGFGNWDFMGINYPEYVLKTSLFGEWDFPWGVVVPALGALVLCLISILISIFYFIRAGFKKFSKIDWLMMANLLIPLAFHIYFRFQLPYFCSEDFRYLAPILISAAYFHGKSGDYFLHSRFQAVRSLVLGLTLFFYAAIMVFIVMIGVEG
jgi:hypothetical protein